MFLTISKGPSPFDGHLYHTAFQIFSIPILSQFLAFFIILLFICPVIPIPTIYRHCYLSRSHSVVEAAAQCLISRSAGSCRTDRWPHPAHPMQTRRATQRLLHKLRQRRRWPSKHNKTDAEYQQTLYTSKVNQKQTFTIQTQTKTTICRRTPLTQGSRRRRAESSSSTAPSNTVSLQVGFAK